MSNLHIPNLFIFDMDGLMFDTERMFREHLKITCRKYGYQLTDALYASTLGTSGVNLKKIMLANFGDDYPIDTVNKETWEALCITIKKEGIPVKEGIPELLEFIKGKGIPCCVASSTPTDRVWDHLRITGLDSYFPYVIGGDQVSRSKPNPDIFLKACQAMKVAPADALVLEDSENGIRAALAGGIPVICIPDLKQPAQDLIDQTLTTCQSARDLIELFR